MNFSILLTTLLWSVVVNGYQSEPGQPEVSTPQIRVINETFHDGVWIEAKDDPLYRKAYIDKNEERSSPSRHRYLHGGFVGMHNGYYLASTTRDKSVC
jgi:hypothetical protein